MGSSRLAKDKECIGVKWVYKTKLNEKGEVNIYRERLVEKAFSQHLGVNFGETFSLVSRLDSIQDVLALAAQNKWKV